MTQWQNPTSKVNGASKAIDQQQPKLGEDAIRRIISNALSGFCADYGLETAVRRLFVDAVMGWHPKTDEQVVLVRKLSSLMPSGGTDPSACRNREKIADLTALVARLHRVLSDIEVAPHPLSRGVGQ